MVARLVASVLFALGLPAHSADTIYKCIRNGQAVYSTRPGCPEHTASKREPTPAELAAEIQAQYEKEKAEGEAKKQRAQDTYGRSQSESGPTGLSPHPTYRPEQLREMIARRQFPTQGPPITTKKPMDYAACVTAAGSVAAAVGEAYPATVVVNTALMYVVKLWTNDAAVVVTCSAPDKSMVTTVSTYR